MHRGLSAACQHQCHVTGQVAEDVVEHGRHGPGGSGVDLVDDEAARRGEGGEKVVERAERFPSGRPDRVAVDTPGAGEGEGEVPGDGLHRRVALVGREPRGGSLVGGGQLGREGRLAVSGRRRQDHDPGLRQRVEETAPGDLRVGPRRCEAVREEQRRHPAPA